MNWVNNVKMSQKCLAVRKISCNFATLLGAKCRLGGVNCLIVNEVDGVKMCVIETIKSLIIIKINQKKLRCLLFSN